MHKALLGMKQMPVSVHCLIQCKGRSSICEKDTRQKGPEAVGCRQVSELSQTMVIGDGGAVAGGLREFLREQKGREDVSLHLRFLSFCYS